MNNFPAAYPGSDLLGPLSFKASNAVTTAGAGTITVNQFLGGVYLRDLNGASRTDTTPTAILLLNKLGPGAYVGQSFEFIVQNSADGAERLTVAAGTGCTITGRAVVDPGEQARFQVILTNISYASGAYALVRIGTSKPVETCLVLSVDGAISPSIAADYVITKAGVFAGTLAAPTTITHDGQMLRFVSTTDNAHTITATGLLEPGTASANVATFAAFAGAGLVLKAYAAKWYVESSTAITFS